jgi:hypothetical protein
MHPCVDTPRPAAQKRPFSIIIWLENLVPRNHVYHHLVVAGATGSIRAVLLATLLWRLRE